MRLPSYSFPSVTFHVFIALNFQDFIMLSDIFGDFVIDEEDTTKERVQFCTPDQYSAEIHNSGWFLDFPYTKDMKDDEKR